MIPTFPEPAYKYVKLVSNFINSFIDLAGNECSFQHFNSSHKKIRSQKLKP